VSLAAYGVEVSVPAGWDARIYARPLARAAALPGVSPFSRRPQAHGGSATLHAASFALPRDDADFGTTATESMPTGGAFLALVEYEAGAGLEPGVGLFAAPAPPSALRAADFAPRLDVRLEAREQRERGEGTPVVQLVGAQQPAELGVAVVAENLAALQTA